MRTRALISLMHPTCRTQGTKAWPNGWQDAYRAFFDRADYPEDVEYILSVHHSRSDEVPPFKADGEGVFSFAYCVANEGKDTCVANLNNAALHVKGDILMGMQDDLFPPEHWDSLLRHAFEVEMETALCLPLHLQFASGSPLDGDIAVVGAVNRAWYKAHGYVLHPDYDSMFSDNEITERDKQSGVLKRRMDIRFEHKHPVFGTAEWDEHYHVRHAQDQYDRGRRIFDLRKAKGFPKESVLNEAGQPKRPVLAVCTPGERFSSAWVFGAMSLQASLLQSFDVQTHFGFSSNVYQTRGCIAQSVLSIDPKPDFVLWIDDDNLPTYQQFNALFARLQHHLEADAVAGWCWCGGDVYEQSAPQVSAGHFGEGFQTVHLHPGKLIGTAELIEVDWTGFPFVLMRRECIEKAGVRPFAPILTDSLPVGFAGEDVSFCHNARARGHARIFVDPQVQVPHLKLRAIAPQAVLEAHKLSKETPAAGPCAVIAAAEAAA